MIKFKKPLLSLFALLLCAVANAQTSTLQPTNPQPAPQVEAGKGKKKSGKNSGKKKGEQVAAGEAAQPTAGATGTIAATTPDATAAMMKTGKGKKAKGASKTPKGGGSAVAEIRAVLDAQTAAWNAGKLEEFMQGYWNSPELTFVSGGRKLMGYDATLERYRRTYQSDGKEMGKLTFGDVEILPIGKDAAFVRGQYQLVMSDARELGGRYTLIVRRFADGWKIVHDHTSSNQ
jgi:beta-aspartyl-peptidase (threonine type)